MYSIYCIEHFASGKKYIGKTSNVSSRFYNHRRALTNPIRQKDCNRYMYNAVQKYGIKSFKFYILEEFQIISEAKLKDKELYWMDFYKTCDNKFGYNLRRDSSTKTTTSKYTKNFVKTTKIHLGENNGNYGNKWSKKQKLKMSIIAKARHSSGKYYGEKWKKDISRSSKKTWKNEALRKQVAISVSKAKQKHDFYQYDLKGNLLKIWASVAEIIKENPEYKWQIIYGACNGSKNSYRGYKWKMKKKNLN